MDPQKLRRACGQLLSVGFEGTSAPVELLAAISRGEVGGVTLFGPNATGGPAQVATLVADLRAAAPADRQLVVSIDQEGGRVQRLRAPLTVWPPMLTVGQAGDSERTQRLGRFLGEELAVLGIGWNLAPVLDVHTNPDNPVIGDRAFGSDPEAVARHALAFWRGLRAAGICGCGKHFPGHGDTETDSHRDLPVVRHNEARLRSLELVPFARAAAAGIEAIMTAHVMFPAIDPQHPATLSSRLLTDLLRGEMGFQGMIVSDDLSMQAVADRYSIEDLVVMSLQAGVDHFLMRSPREGQVRAFEALVRAGEKDSAIADRIDQAAASVARFKSLVTVEAPKPGALLPSLLGTPAHRALAGSFAVGT